MNANRLYQNLPRLYDAMRKLLGDKKEACGLAVNLGPYIGRVPEELLEFGDKKGFPIFTIPWEIRLVDVTRALTTRLNEYEQTEKTLNQAVENAIFRSAVAIRRRQTIRLR